MLQDFFSYLKDWFVAPSDTGLDLVESESRAQVAITGYLAGGLFFMLGTLLTMILHDGWTTFISTFPFGLAFVMMVTVYIGILFVDCILLLMWASILRAEVRFSDLFVIAAFSGVTMIPSSILLIPINLLSIDPTLHLMLVALVSWIPHWVYLFSGARGAAGDIGIGKTLAGAVASMVSCLVFYSVGLGVFLYFAV